MKKLTEKELKLKKDVEIICRLSELPKSKKELVSLILFCIYELKNRL